MADSLKTLYIRLGLSLSDIAKDFLAADKTINENMARLNRESNLIRLRAAVDVASLDAAKERTRILEIQEEALNKQLEIQERRCRLAAAAHEDITRRTGATSNATQRAAIQLERERLAAQNLRNELRELTNARASENRQLSMSQEVQAQGQNLISQMNGYVSQLQGLSNMQGGLQGLISLAERIPGIYGKAAGAMLAMAGAAYSVQKAIVDIGAKSIKSTDETYRNAQKMQMTVKEYGALNKILSLGGSSMDVFAKGIIKLNKSVMTAGTNGNEVTKMLNKFQVVLQEDGHLIGYNEELKRLAEGLQRAKANGQGLEYVTTLFGAKAAELVPILENYWELTEDAAGVVKPLGIDPQTAHDAARQLAVMESNIKNLGGTATAMLVPISEKFIPEISYTAAAVNITLKTLIDLTKSAAKEFDSLVSKIPNIDKIGQMIDAMGIGERGGPLGNAIGNAMDQISEYMKKNGNENWFTQWNDELNAQKKSIKDTKKEHADFSQSIDTENEEAEKSFDDLSKNVKDNTKEIEAAMKQAQESHAKAIDHLRAAEDIYFKQSHNELENSIYSIERWKQAQLEKARTAEEASAIIAEAAAREAEAYEKSAEKAEKANQTLYEKIYKLNHSDTQNQLFDLYKEIFDYRQAGADDSYIRQYQHDKTREILEQARQKEEQGRSKSKSNGWSNWDAIHEYNQEHYGGTYREQLNKQANLMLTKEQQQQSVQKAVIDYEKIANIMKMNNRDITVNANFSNNVLENQLAQDTYTKVVAQVAKDIREITSNSATAY